MRPRGYPSFYPDRASGLTEPDELRDAFDPNAGNAIPHAALDTVAAAMPWRHIEGRACSREVACALALDREAGAPRLKAIISRAYQAGDAFADAMLQDRLDREFAKWATDRPPNKKGQSLAALLDLLVGGGPGLGGSEWQPDHVRLFAKYVDGGAPWEAFEMRHGLLQRAIGAIERNPTGTPGEAEDLFERAQSAIRCLDDIRDALVRRRDPQRFPLARASSGNGLASAIGAFFPQAFAKLAVGRLLPPTSVERDLMNRGFTRGAVEWRGDGVELYRLLYGMNGVQEALDAFLEQLDRIEAQYLAYHYELGFEKNGQAVAIWRMHPDGKLSILQEAKPQDLPRFFFVARLAEVFVASTGDLPLFSNASMKGSVDTAEARWLGLFHEALGITGLITDEGSKSNDNRATLLKRLAGRGAYATEGAGNRARLEKLAALFDPASTNGMSRPIDWHDGFLTDYLVGFMRPFARASRREEAMRRSKEAMAEREPPLVEENS